MVMVFDIMSTHITLNAGERLLRLSQSGYKEPKYRGNFAKLQSDYESLMLFQNNGDGTFERSR